jgi:uncharacterized protein (TIGR00369 family)
MKKTMNLADDGYCFVCGDRNPIGLKLKFSFEGKTIKTYFIPRKEHQGYKDIVHGGIISTLLDEAMVKLALAMDITAVTASMEIRLKRALYIGERIKIEAEVLKDTRKILEMTARIITDNNEIVAIARGKLLKIKTL